MTAPTVISALEAFLQPRDNSNFSEWLEQRLIQAKAALEATTARRKIGHDHKSALISLLAKYDEAEQMLRVTSGETLYYWRGVFEDTEEQISEIIGDVGSVDIARHALFSPAF